VKKPLMAVFGVSREKMEEVGQQIGQRSRGRHEDHKSPPQAKRGLSLESNKTTVESGKVFYLMHPIKL